VPASIRTGGYCWDLTEASGNRAEAWAGVKTLTAVNAPSRGAGLVGNTLGMSAFSTAASSQALNLADNADISTGDIAFTVSCWANPSVLANAIILDKTDEYRLGVDAASKPYAKTGDTDTATAADATTAGAWILVSGGHDAPAGKTWVSVNGGARVETNQTSAPADTANGLRIFSTSAGGSYWPGAVDACGLWKKNVTDATLLALYAAGVGVEWPWSTIAYLFQPSTQWADMPTVDKQRAIWLKTGVLVPEAMFPSRKVYVR
jgi:hypothetical protein